MSAAKTKKCGNAPCTCSPTDGSEYCSAYCEGAEEGIDVVCHCGHTSCEGDVSDVETENTGTESTGSHA
jgi:hypothetical protein